MKKYLILLCTITITSLILPGTSGQRTASLAPPTPRRTNRTQVVLPSTPLTSSPRISPRQPRQPASSEQKYDAVLNYCLRTLSSSPVKKFKALADCLTQKRLTKSNLQNLYDHYLQNHSANLVAREAITRKARQQGFELLTKNSPPKSTPDGRVIHQLPWRR